jgi:peptide/nickel transport system ATP-binding protein
MIPLLKVENLKVTFQLPYGTVEAVKGIDFHVNRGEIVGIVGESGSGKSVTALSIPKLIDSNGIISGKIEFTSTDGVKANLLELSKIALRKYRGQKIGMIFQEPMTSLNPVFRCGNQVVETICLHQKVSRKEAKNRTLQWFQKVQLDDAERIFDAYPHEISGGQKQRVMIAMAMSSSPDLLIADEPTTALDVTVQKVILRLIKSLCEELGTSVLFISHDLGVIAEIANRVLVMQNGKIVESNTVHSIFKHAQHPYTQGLLACRPSIYENWLRLPTMETLGKEKLTASTPSNLNKDVPILTVKNLTTTFYQRNSLGFVQKTIKAVDNVSFELQRGTTLGLVGESGSGKTTLGRSVLRLAEAQVGEIWYEGQDLMRLSDKELQPLRKDLQIIFQDPYSALNPRMTAGNAILEPMKWHKLDTSKEKVVHLLETVGLTADHFGRLPHEFSGGQRQRVCIARALAVQPKFIICDECVSSLDVSIQAQILNLLKDLQEQFDLSYLFISHDLSVIRFMSDHVLVMYNGQIIETEETQTIFENPKTDYTKKLLEAIPKIMEF